MDTVSPLIGRRVRFEGQYSHVEGLVLHVEVPSGRSWSQQSMILLLEITKHPSLPSEPDGACRIMSVAVPLDGENRVYVFPVEEQRRRD